MNDNDRGNRSHPEVPAELAALIPVSRRRLFALAGGAAAAAALAACSSSSSSKSTTPATSASTAAPTTSAASATTGAAGTTATTGATATTATTAGSAAGSSSPATTAAAGTSPATTAAPQPGTPGGRLRVTHGANPTSLDPHAGSSGNDYIMLYPIFDTLIDFEPTTLTPRPGLASSWKFDDPMTFTLTLNSGITFHDGTPLDATAVKFSLDRARTDPTSNIKADLAPVTNVAVVDPMTVRLTLNRADSEIIGILTDRAGMIVSPTAVGKLGADFATKAVGTGPFKLDSYATGATVTYSKFDGYWRKGLPYLDGIDMTIVTEAATRLNALLAGDTDFNYRLPAQNKDQVTANSDLSVVQYVGIGDCSIIYFDTSNPPFDKKEVRQAFNMAVDREAMAKAATFSTGEPMYMMFPSKYWAYRANLVPTYKHDPAGAKALLATAGLANGVTFTLVHQPDADSVRNAEILQAQLKEGGLNAQLNPVELTQSVTDYFVNKKYNSASFGWTGRPDPNMTFRQVYAKDAYFNTGKIDIAGFDDLMNQASSVSSIPDRQAVYDKVVPLVSDAAIIAPLFFRAALDGVAKKVVGYTPNLLAKPKFTEVSLKQ
jgi:ABC-type transport system substrate-binding protein